MSRRTERVGNLIRNELGRILLSKMSDPRFDPAQTSITRVEIPEDLLTAIAYVSVCGTESDQRRTIRALRHAAGYLQEHLGERIRLRNTPRIDFRLDTQFQKTMETWNILSEVMAEIHEKDALSATESSEPPASPNPEPNEPS